MPEVPARWLVPLEGRRPQREEVLGCIEQGNLGDAAGWSEEDIRHTTDCLLDEALPPQKKSSRALWLRVPLISARGVRFLAMPLEVFTGGRILVGLFLLGVVAPLLPLAGVFSGAPDTGAWMGAVCLFLAGAVLHELGHAAALSAQGYPAGGIGAGLLFVIPVLHSDVSAISQLPTRGKLRVDMAGVALQVAYGALLLLLGGQTAVGVLAARMTYFAVGWSLIPFIRADGYWALCDVLGVRDLERPIEGRASRLKVNFILVHRVLNIIFLIFVAAVLPVLWAGRLGDFLPPGPWSSLVIPGLVLLLWGVMGKKIYRLIGLLVGDLHGKSSG